MIVIIILVILLLLGLAFEGKEKDSNLPSFTKREAKQYYEVEFKKK